jgi:hypothetical protein
MVTEWSPDTPMVTTSGQGRDGRTPLTCGYARSRQSRAPSQGGDTGSNPVGAASKVPGQSVFSRVHRLGAKAFCYWMLLDAIGCYWMLLNLACADPVHSGHCGPGTCLTLSGRGPGTWATLAPVAG